MPPLVNQPASATDSKASALPPEPQRGVIALIWGAVATAMAVFYTAILAPCAAAVSLLGHPHLATPITRLWGWLILPSIGRRKRILRLMC